MQLPAGIQIFNTNVENFENNIENIAENYLVRRFLASATAEAIELSRTMDNFDDMIKQLNIPDNCDSRYRVYRVVPQHSGRTYFIAGPAKMYWAEQQQLIEKEQGQTFEELGWKFNRAWSVPIANSTAKEKTIVTGPYMGENLFQAAQRVPEPSIIVCDKWDPA